MQFTDDRVILMFHGSDTQHEVDFSWLDNAQIADFSPDGKNILIWERGEGSESPSGTIFLRNVDGSPPMRLGGGSPRQFSSDGKWVVATVGGMKVILVPTGAGTNRSFEFREYGEVLSLGMTDHKTILIWGRRKDNNESELLLQNADGEPPKVMHAKNLLPMGVGARAISPDGKYVLMRNTDRAIVCYSIESQTQKLISSVQSDEAAFQWTNDRSAILVLNPNVVPAKIFKIDVHSGARRQMREVGPADATGVIRIASLLFSPDEKNFAYSYQRTLSTLYLVQNLN
jgi:eukaryotic-like serine/threonine-protein kinase